MISDWCAGSYRRPVAPRVRRLDGTPIRTGECVACHRRVRLLGSGHLRRHRPFVSAVVAAHQANALSAPHPKR